MGTALNIKSTLTSPKFIHSLIALILGAFGFTAGTEVKERFIAPEVNIKVAVPEQKSHNHPHSHPVQKYTPKDWTDAIERADKRAMDKHKEAFH